MDPVTLAAIIAGIVTIIATGAQASSQKAINDQNIEQADKVNEQTWQREDTSMQRQMADYEAAGINPLMAAISGGGASSSPGQIIAAQPPNMGGLGDLASTIFGGGKSLAETNKTEQETTLLKIDTELREDEKNELLKTLGQRNWEFFNSGDWETEMSEDEKDEWNRAAGRVTVQGWRIQNETDIIDAQKWLQRYLQRAAGQNIDLNRQLLKMNELDLGIKDIMLAMTEEDWKVIEALGPDKAWERFSMVINGIFNAIR